MLVFLSSYFAHDARSEEPKACYGYIIIIIIISSSSSSSSSIVLVMVVVMGVVVIFLWPYAYVTPRIIISNLQ